MAALWCEQGLGDREGLAKPIILPLSVPLFPWGPENLCLPNTHSSIFLWIASIYLWSPNTCPVLLGSGWHMVSPLTALGISCLWILHMCVTKFCFFPPVNLSHVNLILRPIIRILRGRRKFFMPNKGQVTPVCRVGYITGKKRLILEDPNLL